MENIKTTQLSLILKKLASKLLKILNLYYMMKINGLTSVWSIKTTSHTALEELSGKIKNGSLMDNGKMENCMDIAEKSNKMVSAININVKMIILFEYFDFILCLKLN